MQFGLLGPTIVQDASGVLTVPSGRRRVLLAALLLRAGRSVGSTELIELIWDGRPTQGARATLHSHVTRLRRALGPEAGRRLATDRDGYRLTVLDGEFDMAVFRSRAALGHSAYVAGDWARAHRHFDSALALWRGEPLADIDHDRLRQEAAGRMLETRVNALECRADAGLRLGHHHALAAELAGLVTEHPLRERLWGQLMLALYRCGRQADALAAYQSCRRLLVDELGIEPGAELAGLHTRILERDPLLDPPRPPEPPVPPLRAPATGVPTDPAGPAAAAPATPAAPAAAGPQPAPPAGPRAVPAKDCGTPRPAAPPRQLPGSPPHFVGRPAELDRIAALLDAPAGCPVVIAGPPGIGKSALAVRAAHDLADRFPDGVLYLELGGTRTPRPARSLLRRVLTDLGALDLPADPGDLAVRLRELTADRAVLMVLDDAASAGQILPLLPAGGPGRLLVTGRSRRLATDPGHLLDLGPLGPDDCHELFARAIGHRRAAAEPAAVRAVLAHCAGHPLAVRSAAARLGARPDWPIRTFADLLTDAERRPERLGLDDPEVYRHLADALHPLVDRPEWLLRRLRRLGPEEWEPAATAHALGLSPGYTETVLELLVDARLLESPAPGRYRPAGLLRVLTAGPEPSLRTTVPRIRSAGK
ncbi:BTAD domain-containing putative transcriptional regulator [Kitasatospora sp. NPDC054939]